MAHISDGERGLWGRLEPIPISAPVGVRASRAERLVEAADDLGRIYLQLPAQYRDLGEWALPTARTAGEERVLAFQLDGPTASVFGADSGLESRIRRYDRHFNAVMPDVAQQGLIWGSAILKQQMDALRMLWLEIADPEFAAWMNQAAREIQRRAREAYDRRPKPDKLPRQKSRAEIVAEVQEISDVFKRLLIAAAKSFVKSDKLDETAGAYLQPQIPFGKRTRYLQLLQILLVHPRFEDVVRAYSATGAQGTKLAQQLARDCTDAIAGFSGNLAARPGSVWRYPALIIGGVRQLGFGDVAGFKEYALAVAAVIGRRTPESLLSYVGMGLMVVGLLSTGLGAGALVLDLAMNGASVYFNFVKEREQEVAVKASLFLPDENRFALEFSYTGTAIAAAFLMVAAMGLLRAAKPKPKPSTPAPIAAPKPASVPEIAIPGKEEVEAAIKAMKAELDALEKAGIETAAFKEFYLTPRQAQTFSRLADSTLDSAARPIAARATGERAKLLAESELNAATLRRRLAEHWAAALPKRGKQSAEEAALEILIGLNSAPPTKGTLNSNVRDQFFDLWRNRFLSRVEKDKTLILDLEDQAGVVFSRGTGNNAFKVVVRDEAGKLSYVGLDVDHAIIRHEDAVLRALRTNDASLLVSTVDPANLQLMTARENQHVIEKLRALDAKYWSVGPGPMVRAIQPFR